MLIEYPDSRFITGPDLEATQFLNRDRFGGDYFFVGFFILSAMWCANASCVPMLYHALLRLHSVYTLI